MERASLHRGPVHRVRLDTEALLSVGASDVLALDPGVMGRSVALSPEPSAAPALSAQAGGTVGVVRIDGPLAQRAERGLCAFVDGYDAIAARIRAAHLDKEVDAIVVAIDSPGGDVAGLEEGARRLREYAKDSGKPVLVHADETIASAAYRLAVALSSHGIFAPESSRVGSIGTIAALVDESEALKQKGIAVKLIREPAGKVENHPAAPISELAETRARERVKEASARFYADVAAARGIEPRDVEALNGAVFGGSEAKRRGLIDGVQSFEATLALAAQLGREARAAKEKLMTDAENVARLVASVGAKTTDEAIAKIEALMASSENAHEALKVASQVTAELERLKAFAKEREISELVDGAVKAGKVTPAKRETFLAKCTKHGADWARSVIEELVPIVAGGGEAPKGAEVPAVPVDAELEAALKAQGIALDEYRKLKAEMLAQGVR